MQGGIRIDGLEGAGVTRGFQIFSKAVLSYLPDGCAWGIAGSPVGVGIRLGRKGLRGGGRLYEMSCRDSPEMGRLAAQQDGAAGDRSGGEGGFLSRQAAVARSAIRTS